MWFVWNGTALLSMEYLKADQWTWKQIITAYQWRDAISSGYNNINNVFTGLMNHYYRKTKKFETIQQIFIFIEMVSIVYKILLNINMQDFFQVHFFYIFYFTEKNDWKPSSIYWRKVWKKMEIMRKVHWVSRCSNTLY